MNFKCIVSRYMSLKVTIDHKQMLFSTTTSRAKAVSSYGLG